MAVNLKPLSDRVIVEPIEKEETTRIIYYIDVQDGTVQDWDDVPMTFIDALGETNINGCDLSLVAFAHDTPYLYIRWDVLSFGGNWKKEILYDIGLNRTCTGTRFDIFCCAYIYEGVLTNVSIRDATDRYLWDWTQDGIADDGELLYDPVPGAKPGNHSTEARFPLSVLNLCSS